MSLYVHFGIWMHLLYTVNVVLVFTASHNASEEKLASLSARSRQREQYAVRMFKARIFLWPRALVK